ncbi:hypothetical protein K469DRAFT_261821 [Zopfia rhizophila CBS 207.26]|uniref:Uncharacterized protein n=1 Tax=Zopfia rhizophila CBS 207.26 TaxID=1314779 RepID=A0A6A6DQR6_9PEZI|nr:hypothetical protein K469DRAFT_261821 [Zopfia rhizophila CBS 207.26]
MGVPSYSPRLLLTLISRHTASCQIYVSPKGFLCLGTLVNPPISGSFRFPAQYMNFGYRTHCILSYFLLCSCKCTPLSSHTLFIKLFSNIKCLRRRRRCLHVQNAPDVFYISIVNTEGSVRLLKLYPRSKESPLVCSMWAVTLTDASAYEAISYI